MHHLAIILIHFISFVLSQTGPGLPYGQSYCPSCVGTKYTDIATNQTGCCPLGTVYQPASCVPGPLTTTNPTCPADNGKLYVRNGITYKIYCDVTTDLPPDVAYETAANPKACADLCAAKPACADSTYYNGGCWQSTNVLGPDFQGHPLLGSVVFAKQ